MDNIMIKVIKIEEHLKNQDDKLTDIKKQLNDFICSVDIRYANKKETEARFITIEEQRLGKVEKVVYGMIGLILVAFIGALIGLVLK